jgi:hypothetical protein
VATGVTGTTYTLTDADEGYVITASLVAYTDAEGHEGSASAHTVAVISDDTRFEARIDDIDIDQIRSIKEFSKNGYAKKVELLDGTIINLKGAYNTRGEIEENEAAWEAFKAEALETEEFTYSLNRAGNTRIWTRGGDESDARVLKINPEDMSGPYPLHVYPHFGDTLDISMVDLHFSFIHGTWATDDGVALIIEPVESSYTGPVPVLGYGDYVTYRIGVDENGDNRDLTHVELQRALESFSQNPKSTFDLRVVDNVRVELTDGYSYQAEQVVLGDGGRGPTVITESDDVDVVSEAFEDVVAARYRVLDDGTERLSIKELVDGEIRKTVIDAAVGEYNSFADLIDDLEVDRSISDWQEVTVDIA